MHAKGRVAERRRAVWTTLFLLCVCAFEASALDISRRYRSPRNPERKVRASTELIILHTTEAPARSSLNKLCDRGEAHFCVTESGGIYAIVDRDREAFHAGRSMWFGREDVDKFSVGIECVGYHDKPMSSAQLAAIRALVKELQAMYRLSDDRVIAHSHVAYGAPNKWHRYKHRGRKRCGMLFAMPSVRRALGLMSRPAWDAEVRAGRLRNADTYLSSVLYGRVDTMAGRVASPSVVAQAPKSSGGIFAGLGRYITPQAKPAPQAKAQAPPKAASKSAAVRGKSPPAIKSRRAPPQTVAQLKSFGWVQKGVVTKARSAVKIAGRRWNAADTYYTIRNKVIPGNRIDAAHIEIGMCVWLPRTH